MSKKRPIDIWREKLDYLREQEAIAADPSQKFQLQKQIEEAKAKMAQLDSEEKESGQSLAELLSQFLKGHIAEKQHPQQPPADILLHRPEALVGTPLISHNIPMGPQGLGISIVTPGTLKYAQGQTVQIVIGFTFINGAPLLAHPQEFQFRNPYGQVATGTNPFVVPSQIYDLHNFSALIPYYAFNMQPTNRQVRVDLLLTSYIFVNGLVITQSPSTPFFFFW